MQDEIKEALVHALERGESLHNAVISLIQAGYEKKDVLDVANQILAERKGIRIETAKAETAKQTAPSISPLVSISKPPAKQEAGEEEKAKKEEEKPIEKPLEKPVKPLEKAVKPFISRIKFFFPSLILIFYYLFILTIKYSNKITLVWILFGVPSFLFGIILMVNQKTKKSINMLFIIISALFLAGIFIFILLTNLANFAQTIKALFISPKYFFIIWAYILSYLLLILGLIEREKVKKD